MKVEGNKHDVKIKVYNTKCSLDVQGFHGDYAKRFEHLHNLTVGEYFAKHVICRVVDKINKTVDINKLNNHLRVLAIEGKKAVKTKAAKKHCKVCNKDLKTTKTLKCSTCKDYLHSNCVKTLHDEETFRCGPCVVYPSVTNVPEEDDYEDTVESLKRDVVLPLTDESNTESIINVDTDNYECQNCDYTTTAQNQMKEHSCTSSVCTECDKRFPSDDDMKVHITNTHRATKRHRQDTSLLLDPGQSC